MGCLPPFLAVPSSPPPCHLLGASPFGAPYRPSPVWRHGSHERMPPLSRVRSSGRA